jgi:hypothetical protein
MKFDSKSLAGDLAKTACVLPDVPVEVNSELQRMVGDPDDTRSSTFAQFQPNPGSVQMPNPLSPFEGDDVFFTYCWPGAVFQSHDGKQWWIEEMDFDGRALITNRWYPRERGYCSIYDIRRSIHSWVEPVQVTVPPPPPGVRYDAQPVRIVEDNPVDRVVPAVVNNSSSW